MAETIPSAMPPTGRPRRRSGRIWRRKVAGRIRRIVSPGRRAREREEAVQHGRPD